MKMRNVAIAISLVLPMTAMAAEERLSVLCSADMEW